MTAKRWDEMTTEEHAAGSMRRYLAEQVRDAQASYDETCARWRRECAADGIDPELEREYYDIDGLKASLDAALDALARA